MEEAVDMSLGDGSVSHRFVASSVAYSPAWERWSGPRVNKYSMAAFVVFVALVVLVQLGPMWGLHVRLPHVNPVVWLCMPPAMVVLSAGIGGHLFLRSRRKYVITVTKDGITIDRRPGDVYSFADARLGLWVENGVALHLRHGRHRFLLGGRDRRLSPTTPLSAEPVQLVDAWLPEPDFDALLSLDARWSGAVADGAHIRCLLFPNPLLIQSWGPFAFRKTQRLMQTRTEPQLFIDVDVDGVGIRVIDPKTNALTAAAPCSQVTATPVIYHLAGGHAFPSAQNVASDAAGQYFSTMPAMTLSVPGMPPLTVGCHDFSGLGRRFSWLGTVPITNDPPPYTVSAADWLTLVEKCGLTPHLEDTAK
ncbi:hypothetical protein J3E61_001813 [Mycobacterium sp. OAE908]|uniref:hypothetical protein n=1 Tax=Mycobacterium sp. OAE908 TaxID=2817899 RepID=UPI0034E2AD59